MSKVITVQDGDFNVDVKTGVINIGTASTGNEINIGDTSLSAVLVGDPANDGVGFYTDGSSPFVISSNVTGYAAFTGIGGSGAPTNGDEVQDAGVSFARDNTNLDSVGFVGYPGTKDFVVQADNYGAHFSIISTTTAGLQRNLIVADPDVGADIYHAGNIAVSTDVAGIYSPLGSAYLEEKATPGADTLTRGQLWVRNDNPSTLMYTDGDSTDFAVAGGLLTGVSSTGSPLNNEVAVFVDGTTIDSDSTFTWDGTTLNVTAAFEISSSFMGNTNSGRSRLLPEASTATNPNIIPRGDDLDTGIGWSAADALSLVSGGVEMLRLVETGTATTDQVIIAPAGIIGAAATPALAFGDGDSGFYETLDDILSLSLAGTQTWNFASGSFEGNVSNAAALLNSGATATVPTVVPVKTDTNTGIGSAAADQLSLITGGIEANRIIASTLQTTTAATTEIESIAVPSDEGFGFEIHVMGTEDATGDTVFERVFGAIRNQGGTTALVGSTITDRTDDAGATTWVVSVEADDAGDALTVDVTGEAAHTIDWKVSVNLLNV